MGDQAVVATARYSTSKSPTWRRQPPHFHTHSADLAKAPAKLKSVLAAAGSPWGDDKQGKQFHGHYGPNVTKMEHATEILALGLAGIHDAMKDMADGHIDNEEFVRSMFSKIKATPHDSHGTHQ
ncbi:hypothetical protein AB0M68_37960 [Streptomyces sp. NPDC051453]|uniref:hypothetical protein n=1 Tax=Streptomyces sp. NPDC051453 TaxID=3154941 RepID=UPI00341D3159